MLLKPDICACHIIDRSRPGGRQHMDMSGFSVAIGRPQPTPLNLAMAFA